MRATLTLILVPCLLLAATAAAQSPDSSSAQNPTTLPEAPQSPPTYFPGPSASYLYNAGVFCGIGASTSPTSTKPTTGCGAGITFIPLPVFFEFGVMAPQANRSYLTGYISVDGRIPLAATKYQPQVIVGYSRLFETGHALDYGLALALPGFSKKSDDADSMRIELRDYWTFANPAQHNIMLRIGWMIPAND